MPVSPPADVSSQLVFGVKPLAFDQAFSKTQGHGGVVSPLPRHQAMRAPSHKPGHGIERTGAHELHGGTQGVPRGQAEEGAHVAVEFRIAIEELHRF